MILTFKPYKVGDFIEVQGRKGTVTNINIFNTEMISAEHKTIITPNSVITSDTIINYDKIGNIRVDVTVGISYSADLQQAKKVLQTVVEANTHTLDTPVPGVFVSELADSSVNLIVRGFCAPGDYRPTYFSLTEEVKLALDAANIEIPFPQRVVHMTK
ncbi:MAG: mechanosensitive ion channel family protein [Candidatus Peribacteria bacterium]|nr:MAG: mechanosensitive ion channel family protein [Candidatus Peribacteria bacterium]